jgi:hypothetical protein
LYYLYSMNKYNNKIHLKLVQTAQPVYIHVGHISSYKLTARLINMQD